ncbi:MAG: lysostaphin resistance A-like protein [Bacteroidota bacterium]
MTRFINHWSKGSYGPKEVAQALLLMVLFFFLGNLPASLVFAHYGISNLFDAEKQIGFYRLFMLQMFPFVAVLVAFFLVGLKIHKVQWLDWITQRSKPSWKKMGLAFALWSVFLTITFFFQWLLAPENLRWNFQPIPFFGALVLLIGMLPLQVLAEELLFRSYALQGLTARTKKPWLAVLISGLMFGFMHLGNPEVKEYGVLILVLYSALGIFLSLMTALDGGIEIAFGFHLANNLSSGLLVTSKEQALQIPALFSTDSGSLDAQGMLLLLLGLVLFFIVFRRLYAWRVGSLMQNIP